MSRAKSQSTVDLARLGAIRVQTPDGEHVALGSAWRDRPVVLAFVRHFG